MNPQQNQTSSQFLRNRPRRRVTLGTLFGVITIVLFVSYNAGFMSGKTTAPELKDVSQEVKNYVVQLQKENNQLQKDLIFAKSNAQIHVEAQKTLGNHIKTLQQQNTDLKRDMALYQTIAGNKAENQGLEIKSFQIFESEKPNTYRYLLILSKQAAPQKYVEGAVKMVILGKIGDKPIELPVKYVDPTRTDGLGFKFRHLQELAGELSFPDQFVPEGVQFRVTPDKEWPQLQRHFAWVTDNPDMG